MLFGKANSWILKELSPVAQNYPRLCYVLNVVDNINHRLLVTDGCHYVLSEFIEDAYERMLDVFEKNSVILTQGVLMLEKYAFITNTNGKIVLRIKESIYLGEGSIDGEPEDINLAMIGRCEIQKKVEALFSEPVLETANVPSQQGNSIISSIRLSNETTNKMEDLVNPLSLTPRAIENANMLAYSQLNQAMENACEIVYEDYVQFQEQTAQQSRSIHSKKSLAKSKKVERVNKHSRIFLVCTDDEEFINSSSASLKDDRNVVAKTSSSLVDMSYPMDEIDSHIAAYIENIRKGLVYKRPRIVIRKSILNTAKYSGISDPIAHCDANPSLITEEHQPFILKDSNEVLIISHVNNDKMLVNADNIQSGLDSEPEFPMNKIHIVTDQGDKSEVEDHRQWSAAQLDNHAMLLESIPMLPATLSLVLRSGPITPSIDEEDIPHNRIDSSLYSHSSATHESNVIDENGADITNISESPVGLDFIDYSPVEQTQPWIDFTDFIF